MRPYAGRMSIGLIIKISGTLAELALPYILSTILDNVIPAAAASGNGYRSGIRTILLWGGLMTLCALAALIFNIVANRMASRVARDTARTIRHDLFHSTLHLSCAQTDAFTVPSLESRLTSDTYNVHHLVGVMQRLGVRTPILLVGGLIITLALDPVLTLVMLAVLPLIVLTVYMVSHRGVPLYQRAQKSGDAMVRVVREDVQGIRVIKALSRKSYERERYEHINDTMTQDDFRATITMAVSNPLIHLFLNLGLVAVLIVGAIRVDMGLCKPGKIIAFLQYFTLLSNALLSITRLFMMFTKGAASMQRINEVVDAAAAHQQTPCGHHLPCPASEHDYLVFDHVIFSYQGKTDNLKDVHFSLPRGGTLGIIGATGSGKTTLLSLLLHFYHLPEEGGSIRIGGRDIRDMSPAELRAHFGIAMQNDFLFAGTVEENINFYRDLPHEAIEKAARLAQAHDFIAQLPGGYSYRLTSKGTNLSGGQKQRLLIARALAGSWQKLPADARTEADIPKDGTQEAGASMAVLPPDILILDDASSALDYRTDAALRQALQTYSHSTQSNSGEPGGITTILVAQRVSSIKHADLILVFEGGAVIGQGTHDQLMETCDVYREIAQSQMGGAILD